MSPARMDKIETSTRIVLAYLEALKHKDISAALDCLSENCRIEKTNGTLLSGKTEIAAGLLAVAPENLEIEEIFGLGFRCIVRWKIRGQQRRGTEIFRVQDGLICEQLSYVKL